MQRTTRIELFKENFKFSSGHFTLFSATERENIHGHNFTLHAVVDTVVQDNGLVFDYALAKRYLETTCKSLNEYFLLPQYSPYIRIEEKPEYTYVYFADEKIPFLKRDIKILPLRNITIEELASYFVNRFVEEFLTPGKHPISRVEMRVFSGPGQSANAVWEQSA